MRLFVDHLIGSGTPGHRPVYLFSPLSHRHYYLCPESERLSQSVNKSNSGLCRSRCATGSISIVVFSR
jgi:hypothetical protein